MGNIKLRPEEYERRVREYKTDPFIQGCINQMTKVASLAKPFIVLSTTDEPLFDVDEETKTQLDWWKKQIDDHVKRNYPDIVNGDKE